LKTERLKKKKAISPVISALILTATVLSIGGGIWFYSQGAMTITSEYYAESVINMTDTISERFIIEHVYYEEITIPEPDTILHVFVYNYGSVDIQVKLDVDNDGVVVTYPMDPNVWIPIMAGGFEELTPPDYTATSGNNLVIRIYTWRENSVYYRYQVP